MEKYSLTKSEKELLNSLFRVETLNYETIAEVMKF
jgi:hypothetical protein